MKNTMLSLIVFLMVAVPCLVTVTPGCKTDATHISYQTLYAVGHSTDAAYKSYLDLVVAKELKTNNIPRVAEAYRKFQNNYAAALRLAESNPNAPATADVLDASAAVITLTQKKLNQ